MDIYKSIKNPITNDETLRTLVKIYAENNTENINFYNLIIPYGEENNKRNTMGFFEQIQSHAYKKYFSAIKSFDDKKLEDYEKKCNEEIEKLKEKYKDDELTLDEELTDFEDSHPPYKKYKEMIQKYSFDEILKKYSETSKKVTAVLDKKDTFSEEEITIRKLCNEANERHDGGSGIMGFHVAKRYYGDDVPKINPQAKLYINADTSDIYGIARKFWDECEKNGINYQFKVVNPYALGNESKRNDKFVVYSELKDLDKYVEILQKIRKENPKLKIKNPPLLAGTIDDWIGIGVDPKDEKGKRQSYNSQRGDIVLEALNKTFEGVDKKDILDVISKNPEKLDELRKNITKIGKSKGISEEKFCINRDTENLLKKIKKQEQQSDDKHKESDKKDEKDNSDKQDNKKSNSNKQQKNNPITEKEEEEKSKKTEQKDDNTKNTESEQSKTNLDSEDILIKEKKLEIEASIERIKEYEKLGAEYQLNQEKIYNKRLLKELDDLKIKIEESKKYQRPQATKEEIEKYVDLINKGYDDNSPEMIEFFKEIAKERGLKMKSQKEVDNKNEKSSESSKNQENTEEKNKDKKDSNETSEIKNKLQIVYTGKNNMYTNITTGESFEAEKFKNKKSKLNYFIDNFVQEDLDYIFGDSKGLKKAIKKCDPQLILILSDINMDYAKQYVEELSKGEDASKSNLQYAMKYDLREMKDSKKLTFFEKLKKNKLAKFNSNLAEHVKDTKNYIELEENQSEMLPESTEKNEIIDTKYKNEINKSISNHEKNEQENKNKETQKQDNSFER